MKILILSYSYSPKQDPRSFRWTALSAHWAAYGHNVTVVTTELPHAQGDVSGDQLVHVIRIPEMFIGRLRGQTKKSAPISYRGPDEKSSRVSPISRQLCAKAMRVVYNRTLRSIQWPDFAWTWIMPAKNCVRKLIAENSYDVLISVSLPFSGHVVGAMAKRKIPKLKWIMDVGDPFCFLEKTPVNNSLIYRKFNTSIERRYFQQADAISVTTSATRHEYVKRFPESSGKIIIIPPLLSIPLTNQADKESNDTFKRPKRLLYVGRLYKDIRTPNFLIECFYKAKDLIRDDIELHFVGGYDGLEAFVDKIKDRTVVFHGQRSHEVAAGMMINADWLVNIGNETSYQLPSKLAEYVSSGKPILNICSFAEDSSAEFLRDYPSAVSLYVKDNVTEEHIKALANFIEAVKPLGEAERIRWERKFSIEAISRSYEQLFHG